MSKVYIVTSGDYSSYRILAVFSTRKMAKAYCDLYNRAGHYNKADYEPWDLDGEQELVQSGGLWWTVAFDGGGDVINSYASVEKKGAEVSMKDKYYLIGRSPSNALVVTGIVAPDKESAIKVAAERRAQFLAEREGIV